MNRQQALDYLTQCADDNGTHWHGGYSYAEQDCPTCHGTNYAGHLGTPGSRYGRTSAHCAPVAYQHAVIRAREHGEPVTRELLSESMSLVVNDSETPQVDIRDYVVGLAGADLDAMVTGYLECQLWAGLDMERLDADGNSPQLDENYGVDDIDSEYVESVRDELADLIVEHPLAVRMYLNHRAWYHTGNLVLKRRTEPSFDSSQFGHDFYLTREHHGAGFWDRGLGDLGRYLTDIAHWAGSASDLWDNGNGVLAA